MSTIESVCAERTRSILIVDDDTLVLEVLAKAFNSLGFKVFSANNGFEALELFQKKPTDVVLTDIKMPGLDGAEMARRIRDQSPPGTTIAVMTGGELDIGHKLIQQGIVSHCFEKPFTINDICHALGFLPS